MVLARYLAGLGSPKKLLHCGKDVRSMGGYRMQKGLGTNHICCFVTHRSSLYFTVTNNQQQRG